MTTPFQSVPRTGVSLETEVDGRAVAVDIKPPAQLEPTVPPSMLQTILMRSFAVLMVIMFVLMLFMGLRSFNPMMMMGMMSMVMMLGGGMLGVGMMGGKNPQGELDLSRTQYATQLREQRRNAHAINKHIHTTQTMLYPNPKTLIRRCFSKRDMWVNRPDSSAANQDRAGRAAAESIHTSSWGCARIGVGYRRAYPYLVPAADDAPETYEPVKASAYMRFIRTQNVITNCPIGIDVFARPFIVCAGNDDRIIGAARSMICSLALGHSPRHLQLGIITADTEQWDWMKWLPHCKDLHRRDLAGPARLHWPSISSYATDQADIIAAGGPHGAFSGDGPPYRVIFVDTPNSEPDIPAGISSSAGLAGHTFVYLRFAQN